MRMSLPEAGRNPRFFSDPSCLYQRMLLTCLSGDLPPLARHAACTYQKTLTIISRTC